MPLQSGDRWAPSFRLKRTNHRLAKRCLDVFGACICLLAFLPLLLMVAVLVRLSSPGPILLRQARVGKHGRAIRIYKFRTMFANSDPTIHEAYCRSLIGGSAKPVDGMFKLGNDPRITRVGRIARRFSLDELPQLLNVFKGDMSLIGPRPPLPYEVDLYDERARRRLSVAPGLTGLWQVSGRNTLDFQQMVALDLEYIARWSFWLDMLILMRTPLTLVTARGAR